MWCWLTRRFGRCFDNRTGRGGVVTTRKRTGLGHVVFYVKDLQRSLAFYRDLFGSMKSGGSSMALQLR